MKVIISISQICPYNRLFCTDNTIEFFPSVVRRTWKTITGSFCMIEECTVSVSMATSYSLYAVIHAHKLCTFMTLLLRHEISIVFHHPVIWTAVFSWYEEQCRSGRDMAHCTRSIMVGSSLNGILVLHSMYFTMMIY